MRDNTLRTDAGELRMSALQMEKRLHIENRNEDSICGRFIYSL